MPNLSVPTPVLKPADTINAYAKVEEPIEVECGPVSFPDGLTVSILEATKFAFYLFREDQGQQPKAWDKKVEAWRVESDINDEDKEFTLLSFDQEDAVVPWKSLFVAMGLRFQKTDTASGFPQYFIKCYFEAEDSNGLALAGLSSPSNKIKLLDAGYDHKAGVMAEQPLESAKWVHMFLKDSNRKLIGKVELKSENDVGEIKIINYVGDTSPLSSVSLNKDGEIELIGQSSDPSRKTSIKLSKDGEVNIDAAAGKKTTINGSLEITNTADGVKLACNDTITIKSIIGEVAIEGVVRVNGDKWQAKPIRQAQINEDSVIVEAEE
jgi:hypothetical protein